LEPAQELVSEPASALVVAEAVRVVVPAAPDAVAVQALVVAAAEWAAVQVVHRHAAKDDQFLMVFCADHCRHAADWFVC
jgi:hypothetical protein